MSDSTHKLAVADAEAHEAQALLAEIEEVMAAIRALHATLAECPDDGGQAEAELLRLIEQRHELARSLGPSLVRWLVAGGQVALTPSAAVSEEPLHEVPLGSEDDVLDTEEPEPVVPEPEATPELVEEAGGQEVHPVVVEVEEPDPEPPPATEPAARVVTPEATPVSQAALKALAQGGLTPNWSNDNTLAQRQRALRRILREIGSPTRPRTLNQVHQAVEALARAIAGMNAWLDQPRETQRALMGLVSSMARHLQDEQKRPLDASDTATMSTLFSRMTRWSGEHRPGFVSGLSRANSPDTESWLSDAREWWKRLQRDAHPAGEEPESPGAVLRDLEERIEEEGPDRNELLAMVKAAVRAGVSQSDPRLVSLLLPHRDTFKGAKGLKTLKTQLRQAQRAEEAEPAAEDDGDDPMPPGWPLFHRTRGKVAVIVGGDDRSHAADRIKAAFEFGEVEWESGSPRRAAALAERVKAGRSVDMVILLRNFISHRFPDMIVPACKESGVDLVVVDHGYGVTQVRLAMERFLDAADR